MYNSYTITFIFMGIEKGEEEQIDTGSLLDLEPFTLAFAKLLSKPDVQAIMGAIKEALKTISNNLQRNFMLGDNQKTNLEKTLEIIIGNAGEDATLTVDGSSFTVHAGAKTWTLTVGAYADRAINIEIKGPDLNGDAIFNVLPAANDYTIRSYLKGFGKGPFTHPPLPPDETGTLVDDVSKDVAGRLVPGSEWPDEQGEQ